MTSHESRSTSEQTSTYAFGLLSASPPKDSLGDVPIRRSAWGVVAVLLLSGCAATDDSLTAECAGAADQLRGVTEAGLSASELDGVERNRAITKAIRDADFLATYSSDPELGSILEDASAAFVVVFRLAYDSDLDGRPDGLERDRSLATASLDEAMTEFDKLCQVSG